MRFGPAVMVVDVVSPAGATASRVKAVGVSQRVVEPRRRIPDAGPTICRVAYEMSIEVLDGDFPAWLWMQAHGDSLVEVALQCDVVEWRWQHFDWGTVLEIDFADEAAWERFRASPAVQAALDAVPDRISGLMIYRGRGGTSAPREPRRPRPLAGAGAAALEFPDEWVFEPAGEPPHMHEAPPVGAGRG